jgi:putative transposase
LIKSLLSEKCLCIWILIADEGVITKARKHINELGKFFISSESACSETVLSEFSTAECGLEKVHPLVVGQLLREDAKQSAPKAVKNKNSTGKAGRLKTTPLNANRLA